MTAGICKQAYSVKGLGLHSAFDIVGEVAEKILDVLQILRKLTQERRLHIEVPRIRQWSLN